MRALSGQMARGAEAGGWGAAGEWGWIGQDTHESTWFSNDRMTG